jgi:hypothetical protein
MQIMDYEATCCEAAPVGGLVVGRSAIQNARFYNWRIE